MRLESESKKYVHTISRESNEVFCLFFFFLGGGGGGGKVRQVI